MAATPMDKYLLLLVRSDDDIPRACREVGEFLAFHRSHPPTIQVEHERRLIGMWVDPFMADTPPEVLGRSFASGHRQFKIAESVGLSGIWQLCWLDADLPEEPADLGSMHESLVSALAAERPQSQHPPTQRFVPIFDSDDRRSFIHLQSMRLRELFPGMIGEAVTFNRTTGALATLSGPGHHNRPL
jgi:hypothetical protein